MLSGVHGIKVATFSMITTVYDLEDAVVVVIRGTCL